MIASAPTPLLDTGPWVALHSHDDTFHAWARAEWARLLPPLLTCESVDAETCILPARGGHDPAKALALMSRGVVEVGMSLPDEAAPVQALFERSGNVPASLADACPIRMSELPAAVACSRWTPTSASTAATAAR